MDACRYGPPTIRDARADEYRYDPHDPRPLMVDFNDVVGASATADHSGVPDRHDVLDFVSPPLAESVELTGPITAHLFVSTDAADTDFTAELYRVREDGGMRSITTGIQRLRYRDGIDDPVPPGTVVEVTVDLWATSLVLDAGERLHVRIASSLWPGMARNMNTLGNPFDEARGVVATNRVHHDAGRPSRVRLPVAPATRVAFRR